MADLPEKKPEITGRIWRERAKKRTIAGTVWKDVEQLLNL